ncbi:MAG: bacillithiol biosynthesis deacetylase BshB1 [Salibacteraceae bacterium]
MKLDILAFGAHPDDVELGAGGTLIKHLQQGKKVGIVDLTRGELGTRGSADLRDQEAARSSEIMGLTVRENLHMADGFFEHSRENLLAVVRAVRKYQPDIVLANAISDRHPDHGKGSKLVSEGCFLAGLVKIETESQGQPQEKWRPKAVYHYIQDRYIHPDFVVDVSEQWDLKMQTVLAFSSQFRQPQEGEDVTPLTTPEFMDALKGKFATFGRSIQAAYAEGFTVERTPGVHDLFDLH